jgi:hypothetical protein
MRKILISQTTKNINNFILVTERSFTKACRARALVKKNE